jgi:hypothetical protein
MIKASTAVQSWYIEDNMRAFNLTSRAILFPNLSNAEATGASAYLAPNSTGFAAVNGQLDASTTYIYIAIRRGPMKVPTDATKVFAPTTYTGNGNTGRTISTVLSPTDLLIMNSRASSSPNRIFTDRLRGSGTGENSGNMRTLTSTSNVAESNSSLNGYYATLDFQTSVRLLGSSSGIYNNGSTGYVLYTFQRAPSFFDEICFTVSGSVPLAHNLTVRPELVIYKTRGSADSWWTCANVNGVGQVNNNGAWAFTGTGNGLTDFAQATSTTISNLNGVLLSPSNTVVAYLFATCPGVSKVGSYTGTGAAQTINCGFVGGSRFVMIKRTDSTGDWYVWDSARGIIPSNDPYLLLNSTAAEVTGTDYVDTTAVGFDITSTAPADINANGGTFIFLAIA